ncbi:HD domain-containing protein [Symbiobacterium thermophilum]|uniref:HDIG domain-containing protein n=1 Tax=Symbiobacterium thermophilum TaxID=2734 RepID=A0A953I6S7_SYMTR|nr:HD domain-containing protein [Symbiobacterium thermophilum]MBY6275298.1 HDIG domain-containing protein [Symbiobacterium thermophilum]
MTREEAWQLVNEYVKSPRLINHLLAVEACMRYFARLYGEDEETWGLIGLLHDFDYERWPTIPDHPLQGERILAELGVPEDIRYTICSHADALADRYPRRSLRDKVLYAVDELSGLVVATALVRPTKSIHDVDVQAVRKKMKDKRFAAGVSREDILRGVQDLGVDLDEHIGHVIRALQSAADALGLVGTAASDD